MSCRRLGFALIVCCLSSLGCKPRSIELAPGLDAALTPDSSAQDGTAPEIPGLLRLRIDPASDEATYDGAVLDEQPSFRAVGSFADGDREVTDKVGWSLARHELGTIAKGRFETVGVGGVTLVFAQAGAVAAQAELRVKLDILLNPQGLADDVLARFAQDAADRGPDRPGELALPRIVYPADDTVIPSNLAHLRTQWQAPSALDRFELRFEGPFTRLRYYTDQRSWLDDAVSSRYLAPSHPGSALTLRVRGLASGDPGEVYRSPPAALQVALSAVPSATYYWSTTSRGIKRGHLAAATSSQVTRPAPAGADGCAGCHALSSAGNRLAYANGTEKLAVLALPEQTPVPFESAPPPGMAMPAKPPKAEMMAMPPGPAAMMMPGMPAKGPKPPEPDYGWGTWNPAATRLLYANKGKLKLIDAISGREVGKVDLPPGASATHPDWAPDGRAVAVTYKADGKLPPGNKQVRGTSIYRLPVRDDGLLGAPEPLVASEGPDDTLLYPSYAPDGRWLAFVRTSGAGKDSSSAAIYIVDAEGARPPVRLDRLNRIGDVEALGAANTLPTWLPSINEGVGFISFSSDRDYGEQLIGQRRDQLWASAIDFEALATGADPSAPPFWLPFQDPLESNHRALWSASQSDTCPSLVELCNQYDDDCDGSIDESCCSPSSELCGDGIDNDCDGVADEGCGCASVDLCDNQLDEDCDLKVDEDCRE